LLFSVSKGYDEGLCCGALVVAAVVVVVVFYEARSRSRIDFVDLLVVVVSEQSEKDITYKLQSIT
jgi:hypothetical protein